MKDAPEVSWHVKFDTQNIVEIWHGGRPPSSHHRPKSSIEPKHNLTTLGINMRGRGPLLHGGPKFYDTGTGTDNFKHSSTGTGTGSSKYRHL